MMSAEPGVRLADYQLRLPVFEGPLDVLLRMIERSQLEITDVSLVAVTEQFLAFVRALDGVPPALVAEFTATTARLLVLKSRSLLPVPAAVAEEPEPDDLTRQLIEYQTVKAAAEQLRERERLGLRAFAREVDGARGLPAEERLAPVAASALVRALRRCLARMRPEAVVYAPPPVVTLAEMTRRLVRRLAHGPMRFSSLVGETPTRSEYVVAFMALLSLLRRRALRASQATLFGEIELDHIDPTALPVSADD